MLEQGGEESIGLFQLMSTSRELVNRPFLHLGLAEECSIESLISMIPVWIRSVLPTSALEAHEEAWNAYPYTKTRFLFYYPRYVFPRCMDELREAVLLQQMRRGYRDML